MRLLGIAFIALVGCADQDDYIGHPLSSDLIRSHIVGRTFTGTVGAQRFFITFDPNGTATYYGADAQYAHWRATGEGLCIRWYDAPQESCAPVVPLGYLAYRVGGVTMQEMDIPHRF